MAAAKARARLGHFAGKPARRARIEQLLATSI
jgi:hypothetical protein